MRPLACLRSVAAVSLRQLAPPPAAVFNRAAAATRRNHLSTTTATMASSAPAAGKVSSAPAEGFVTFVNEAVSPYQAVAAAEVRLRAAGFTKLSERESWSVAPGGKYYVVRNQSAVLAFAVGGKYVPGNGFTIAAAHTDSPCLRVKPVSALTKPGGYLSVGVETYGGGLWYSWLDRDLSLAGRVIVRKPGGAGFDSRLVRVDRPLLRIPSLAIHLNREVNSEGLKLNAENHLAPVLCTAVRAKLDGNGAEGGAKDTAAPAGTGGAGTRHHAPLVTLLAAELGCAPEDVQDFDLCLYDTQPAALGGLYREFVYSGRLDNLMMTYTTLSGLIDSVAAPGALDGETNVRIAASFDHEEVGSASVPGAGSTFLEDTMRRLCPDPALLPVAVRRSVLVSADMAHAVHPNYPGLHEENHRPLMHGGIVIKCNANQRYATTSVSAFLFRSLAAEAGVPVQNFVVRQDMGCGSTIGPIVATRLGLRTVDVGLPQLSMHSVREMCGADDVAHGVRFFGHFYGAFPAKDAALEHAD